MPICQYCQKLKERIRTLEDRLQLIESKSNLRKGFEGEQLISRLVNGKRTMFTTPHDVTTRRGGKKLEVKFARLNKAKKIGTTMRWTWGHALGFSGMKHYNRLILVGEADPALQNGRTKTCPYVFFDVPFSRVRDVMRSDGLIQISTNPQTARTSEARLLFDKYQVTSTDLKKRYGF
jgi:hypothetical protein